MNYVRAYLGQITSGEVVVSKKVARVYRKLVDDMGDMECPWEFDERRAEHAVAFIERFCKLRKLFQCFFWTVRPFATIL